MTVFLHHHPGLGRITWPDHDLAFKMWPASHMCA